MTNIKEKINTSQIADRLKGLQVEFNDSYEGLPSYLKAKPLNVDLEVNKDDIVIRFDLNKDTDFTIVVSTEYDYNELVNISIIEIEADSYVNGSYNIDANDADALLLEIKRIIHDAVHYKLLDEDNEIETNFYDDVYA